MIFCRIHHSTREGHAQSAQLKPLFGDETAKDGTLGTTLLAACAYRLIARRSTY